MQDGRCRRPPASFRLGLSHWKPFHHPTWRNGCPSAPAGVRASCATVFAAGDVVYRSQADEKRERMRGTGRGAGCTSKDWSDWEMGRQSKRRHGKGGGRFCPARPPIHRPGSSNRVWTPSPSSASAFPSLGGSGAIRTSLLHALQPQPLPVPKPQAKIEGGKPLYWDSKLYGAGSPTPLLPRAAHPDDPVPPRLPGTAYGDFHGGSPPLGVGRPSGRGGERRPSGRGAPVAGGDTLHLQSQLVRGRGGSLPLDGEGQLRRLWGAGGSGASASLGGEGAKGRR